jgi:hypothetical protein
MTWTLLALAGDGVLAAEAEADRPASASATIADVITARRRCLADVMKLVIPRI